VSKEWPAWRYRKDDSGNVVPKVFESASELAADPNKDWSDHPAKIGLSGAEADAAVSPPAAATPGAPGFKPKLWPGWRYRKNASGTVEGRQFESAAELAADPNKDWADHPDAVTPMAEAPTASPEPATKRRDFLS